MGHTRPQTDPRSRSNAPIQDAVIRLAGNSQDGIQIIGSFLARLAGRTDKDVMTYMTIPATISGGASIYQVRSGTGEILSAGDDVDVLVAFHQHSYNDHVAAVREGGVVLYDLDQVQPDGNGTRHRAIGVPITSLTVEAIGGSSRDKGKNMFVLGLLTRLFDLDRAKLQDMLATHFQKKGEPVVRSVIGAFDAGYGYDIGKFTALCHFGPPPETSDRLRVVMDGNQAIAYGALVSGVRFGASYPITPATTIMEILRAELPKYGGLLVQAEDELAAIAMVCGASYAGHLGLTSTSGPGLSLKSEALGWAVMAEMPVLIVDVQRGGPATGLPTMVEQSDLNLACTGTHGDAPRIVLAPASVEDCFYTTIEAVKLARKYSCPVIILSDQALATRVEAWKMPDLAALMRDLTPKLATVGPGFKPYRMTDEGIASHAPPGTPTVDGKFPIVTGLEHDEDGHPCAQPKNHAEMVAKRRRKIELLASRLPRATVHGPPEGDVLLVGWGSTQGPIWEAVARARGDGQNVSALHLRYLMPFQPGIQEILDGFRQVLVVEMNDRDLHGRGQLGARLRSAFSHPDIRGITKTEGLSFKVREILQQMNTEMTPAPKEQP
jgi:2-oxoglutarate ferredoxin oxidoreductase subunit alpha